VPARRGQPGPARFAGVTRNAPIRLGIIGLGGMARYHLRYILGRRDTVVAALCEPSPAALAVGGKVFTDRGLAVPPTESDWRRFIDRFGPELDAALIITPHVFHHDMATAALEAGLDVLLEKPMVMTAAEAESLIATRDRTGRVLVVAFQGSLSPQVRTAAAMLRSGELGAILNIDAVVWQDWQAQTVGTWRQDPLMSGGGFMFDTGAHLLNTVTDLAGEGFSGVAAWLANDGSPVDVRGAVMARLTSGGLVTMNACGRAIPSCTSDIKVFCEKAIIRTGVWGEFLEIQRDGEEALSRVRSVRGSPVWEQFLEVRAGRTPNPSPPEVGLRMARLWDAIRASAAQGGAVVDPRLDVGDAAA
jgi:predicted dehydrogenase